MDSQSVNYYPCWVVVSQLVTCSHVSPQQVPTFHPYMALNTLILKSLPYLTQSTSGWILQTHFTSDPWHDTICHRTFHPPCSNLVGCIRYISAKRHVPISFQAIHSLFPRRIPDGRRDQHPQGAGKIKRLPPHDCTHAPRTVNELQIKLYIFIVMENFLSQLTLFLSSSGGPLKGGIFVVKF